jgi:hypothetical protein
MYLCDRLQLVPQNQLGEPTAPAPPPRPPPPPRPEPPDFDPYGIVGGILPAGKSLIRENLEKVASVAAKLRFAISMRSASSRAVRAGKEQLR